MDDEWETVKSKKKPQQKKPQQTSGGVQWGGKTAKGTLIAGPVKKPSSSKYDYSSGNSFGGFGGGAKMEQVNQAQAIADYDFGVDEEQKEIKFETVSHKCAVSVANARLAADMSQSQLAAKVNEKPSAIVDIENGTARYNADLINRIERALGKKIDRGRRK